MNETYCNYLSWTNCVYLWDQPRFTHKMSMINIEESVVWSVFI